jgi:hypothetical protein
MKQWLKSLQNVQQVQASNCATMQHHSFEELHQTFTTFIWPKSTNPYTHEWYFTKWMMVTRTPLIG